MPIMDGRRFLEIRAQDPILRDIPVVVVSGNPPLPQLPKGIEAYLTKPVNVDRLINMIKIGTAKAFSTERCTITLVQRTTRHPKCL